jgi:nicotinate phosphoribosyltransferase
MPIIQSLLDTDFYKVTMAQAVKHTWPDTWVKYRFKNRSKDIDLLPYRDQIQAEVATLGELKLSGEEYEFLRQFPFLKRAFVDGLRTLRLDPNHVVFSERDGQLDITVEGNWYDTIWFEVPLLAIVNEVYFSSRPGSDVQGVPAFQHAPLQDLFQDKSSMRFGWARLYEKIDRLITSNPGGDPDVGCGESCEFRIMEFGTRRRYSREWQESVVSELVQHVPQYVQGTSNVDLARRLGIKPQGTMAHEWLQAHQALSPLHEFQRHALNNWLQEFRGYLGIALSDVVGFEQFLLDFDLLLARSFDGARHDSGNPFWWGERLVAHYRELGIDPRSKMAVFSDGLDLDLCFRLWERFRREIKTVFGVGTNLTNDVGHKPLQLVMKLVEVNRFPVAKISDSRGKGMCEVPEFEEFLRVLFRMPV